MTSRTDLGPAIQTFRASYRVALPLITTFGAIFLLAFGARYWKTRDVAEIVNSGPQFVFFWLAISLLLVGVIKLQSVTVHERGLRGRTFWSLPINIAWHDVHTWGLQWNSGFISAVLTERDTGREMWMPRDVYFSEDFQALYRQHVTHPVPKAF